MAALWMFFALFVLFVAGVSILMVCTQQPGLSRGLLAETLLILLLGVSGLMVLLFRCRKAATSLRLEEPNREVPKVPEEMLQPQQA